MDRPPLRPQRNPSAPWPASRFPSPPSCWGFPGGRSQYAGSPRGSSPHFPRAHRGFASQRGRGDAFRRPQSYSPTAAPYMQGRGSDPVQKYFSPAMLQDPWTSLQPITPEAAAAARRTT